MKAVTLILFKSFNDWRFEQIFIVVEDINIVTNYSNTTTFQEVFIKNLHAEIADFCLKDPYYLKEDFTVIKSQDMIYNDTTNRDVFNLFTANYGVRKSHLVFSNTYAIKFCQLNNIGAEDLKIYTANNPDDNPIKLDINNYYVIAQKSRKQFNAFKEFKVACPNKETCAIVEIFRINDCVQGYVLDNACVEKLKYQKIGNIDLSDTYYFEEKGFKKLPIIRVGVNFFFYGGYPLVYMYLSTIFKTDISRFYTIEPFEVKYADY